MRRTFNLIVVLVVVLLVSLGVLLVQPSIWPEAATRITQTLSPSQPDDKKDKEAKPDPWAKAAAKQPGSHVAKVSPTAERSAEEPALDPHLVAAATAPKYRSATTSEIGIGTSKSDVLATYGPAHVSVTGADRGLLQERMIYRDRANGKMTVISLVNGKVTKTETLNTADGLDD